MCEHCMDKTSENLRVETGIREDTIDFLDALLVDAMQVGYAMAVEDMKPEAEQEAIEGDPLRAMKQALVTYIARLEAEAVKNGVALDPLLLQAPAAIIGPVPDICS